MWLPNYKLVRTSILKSLSLTCSGFDLDFEISDKLALATQKISEVLIDFEQRTYQQGEKSDTKTAFGHSGLSYATDYSLTGNPLHYEQERMREG